jgi:hypothetical protein
LKIRIAAAVTCCLFLSPYGFTWVAAAASACPPAVALKGDPTVVVAIGDILSRNGISTAPEDGCPSAEATVARSKGGFAVRIQDPSERLIEREVVDCESAASIIESWVRSDLSANMLSPPTVSAPYRESNQEKLSTNTEDDQIQKSDSPSASALIDLGFEAGAGFDGSVWFGGVLSGCAILGPTCLGAAAKLGSDPALSGDSELLETRRMILDLLAVADFPFFLLEGFTLRPGIEAGAIFLRLTKVDDNNGIKELIETERWELAVGAHLKGALKLGRGFSLLIGISVSVLPIANTSPFNEDDTWVTGSPRGVARFAVGLEYGL